MGHVHPANAGNDLHRTTELGTDFYVDIENALEALCPRHRGAAFKRCAQLHLIGVFRLVCLAPLAGCDHHTVLAVRRKHAVVTD